MQFIPAGSPAALSARDFLRTAPVQLTEVAAAGARRSFVTFAKRAWGQLQPEPPIWGWHMDAMCEHLVYVTLGEIRFLMISVPPRMSKTMLASVLWPAWHWLHIPGEQFLTCSVDNVLAADSSRLSRRLIESPWYQKNYPNEIELFDDENTVGMYRNTKGGYRMTASVQGRITGVGGTTQIADDFHDAKKVESDAVRLSALAFHDNAWRSRVNNPETAKKVYIGQRTHDNDVYGHVLEQEGERWCHLVLPMLFEPRKKCITFPNNGEGPLKDKGEIFHDPRTEAGEVLDKRRFSARTAEHERSIMAERAWLAQYQQEPVGSGGLILKRHWWRPWVYPEWRMEAKRERPMPQFDELIQVYDTAFEEEEENDFCARTTWGLFNYMEQTWDKKHNRVVNGKTRKCAMLLDKMMEKFTYPDLRSEVIESYKAFDPDSILVEKKASGHDLVNELRRKQMPIRAVKLSGSGGRGREGDLIARAHSASLMLEKGCIFHPPRQFAYETIEMSSKFPNGPLGSRDIVSTLVIAWMYMRRYHDLELPDDEPAHEISPWKWPRKRYA